MQDQPTPEEVLAAVARFLRDVVAREVKPHTAYKAKVAANAVDLVARQLTLAPKAEARERADLSSLLGREVTLPEGNDALAKALAEGEIDLQTPGIFDHLVSTTLAKLAVDQPNYSGYRAALAARPDLKDA